MLFLAMNTAPAVGEGKGPTADDGGWRLYINRWNVPAMVKMISQLGAVSILRKL